MGRAWSRRVPGLVGRPGRRRRDWEWREWDWREWRKRKASARRALLIGDGPHRLAHWSVVSLEEPENEIRRFRYRFQIEKSTIFLSKNDGFVDFCPF